MAYSSYIKPLIIYVLLLVSVFINKIFNVSFLTPFILLLPLIFVDTKDLNLKSVWNFSLIFVVPIFFISDFTLVLSQFLTAFSEELFFRVYMMKYFSNLITSILFTVPHIVLYNDLHSFLVFFPSLFYGFVYQRTKSLILVTVLHFLSNVFYAFFFVNWNK
ncbi:MAG: CPBP family intramembrane metalloprotease [Sulfurihydrogenibium sp.]|nr:MAG: CPBP family intramembrane metalloprotease [Sulfurihydrogenibium sp.]